MDSVASQLSPTVGAPESNPRPTRALLTCGLVAGPLYVIVGAIQAFTCDGFDPTRHALSLLSNGEYGWVQVANFIATGLLVVAGAAGMRRAMHPGRGATWAPVLLIVYGLGLIGAGVFVADPAPDFPPRAAAEPVRPTLHGLLHFVSGAIGFLGLISACFVFAHRFAALKQGRWSLFSGATGVIFLGAFVGIASGSGKAWTILAFTAAVVLSWSWMSAVSARLMSVVR